MVATTVLVHRETARPAPDELVSGVHDVMKSIVHHLQPVLEEQGISKGQFWALHTVSSLEQPTLSTVAHHLAISAPTLCADVDQLEENGLVARHRSDRDRRTVQLSLTAKGRRAEAKIWGHIGRLLNESAKGLPDEDLATTVRVFRELYRRLETAGIPSRGRP